MSEKKQPWLDQSQNIKRLVHLLVVACVISVAIDFFVPRHGHFSFEEIPGFFAFYGFVTCCAIVFAAIALRRFIMRDENYYD